ncbi:MarR family winged helix-turn-helix transcriptional regulator [Rhodococcus sp. UNC363MFTsu5.1]|uniref:MarR family winged helix-turn-helix transcriptional regulator n=1 Tax=Rhodococcus sp. UNC363MFTsu5.1 TaxID=1449069 RepID=UPI00056D2384|nr:winged helix DNA-binding protein [Rhodococcus sp. UNC363MFTsu5.1]
MRMIGFQLKRLDQLIETTLDRSLDETGLSRREWQTLNTISRGPADDAHLVEALRPFWEVNGENVAEVVTDLTERGWVGRGPDNRIALTGSGSAAHAAAAEKVGSVRDLSVAGIRPEDYATMMDVLQRMIANLE